MMVHRAMKEKEGVVRRCGAIELELGNPRSTGILSLRHGLK